MQKEEQLEQTLDISTLINSKFLSDIVVKFNGENLEGVPSHKVILAAASKLFYKQLTENSSQNELSVEIPKEKNNLVSKELSQSESTSITKGEIIKRVFQLAYLEVSEKEKAAEQIHNLELDYREIYEMLKFSSVLGFQRVQQLLQQKMVTKAQNQPKIALALLAASNNMQESEQLRQGALSQLAEDFDKCLRSTSLLTEIINLPYLAFKAILDCDELDVESETDILQLVYQYILARESLEVEEEEAEDSNKKEIEQKEQNVEKPLEADPPKKEELVQVVASVEQKEEVPQQENENPSQSNQEKQQAEENKQEPPAEPPAEQPVDNENKGLISEGEGKAIVEVPNPLPVIEQPAAEIVNKEPIEKKESENQVQPPPTNKDGIEKQDSSSTLKALTRDQKVQLLLSVRLGEVSHESLLKYSDIDVLREFKELFLQALSFKLSSLQPTQSDFQSRYQFNLRQRKSLRNENMNDMQNSNRNISANQNNPLEFNMISQIENISQEDINTGVKPLNSVSDNINDLISNQDIGSKNNSLVAKLSAKQNNEAVKNYVHNNMPSLSSFMDSIGVCGEQQQILKQQINSNKVIQQQQLSPQLQKQIQQYHQNYSNQQQQFSKLTPPQHQSYQSVSPQFQSQVQQQYQNLPPQFQNQPQQYQSQLKNQSTTSLLRPPQPIQMKNISDTIQNNQPTSNKKQNNDLDKNIITSFVYEHDMDENGALFYLGTSGKKQPYQNPHILNQVQAFASSIRVGNIEFFVGRESYNLSTCNEKMSYLGVDLLEGKLFRPTAYTIRNRNSTTYSILNWRIEGSGDGEHFIPFDERVHYDKDDQVLNQQLEKQREALKQRGGATSYLVDQQILNKLLEDHGLSGFRYFRVVQTTQNSHQSDNLSLSGFELYGTAIGNGWIL